MSLLTERYSDKITGVISCYDRIVITGTIPRLCYAQGMTDYLNIHQIRIFDYTQFAEPLREEIRSNAERLAQENGMEIEFIRSKGSFRKEDRIKAILKERGDHPGLVHIFSAMEPCTSYEPWHDKNSGRTFLRYKDAKCLHYYFYFLDPEFGLCYLRVPTWAPFRLQFYCNGHNWLANQLDQHNIAHTRMDNTFASIADFHKAQTLSDQFPVERLHQILDRLAVEYCPVIAHFADGYHWSLMQVEYATDLIFRRQEDLAPLYETLVRTAIHHRACPHLTGVHHAVKPENVATFLGRKLDGRFQDELGNDFHTRLEGKRIKHHMGPVAIKMYDKQGLVLRIETTVNDVTFFKHHRKVEQRDGTSTVKWAPMQKTIYSIPPLRQIMEASNRRYLEFISELVDPTAGVRNVDKIAEPVQKNNRNYPGFNLFDQKDRELFIAVVRGEFCISGLQNSTLRRTLTGRTSSQISRLLKRLRLHGLIKKNRTNL